MSDILAYTLSLNDKFSSTMKKIGINTDTALNSFSKLQTQAVKVQTVMNSMGVSVSSLNLKLDLLRNERDLIPAKNITDIRKYNKEIQKTETAIEKLTLTSKKGVGISGMLGMAGLGLGIGALYEAGSFIKGTIADFNEAAQAEAQVKATLKSTGGISGKDLGGLKTQASDLSGKTLYENDVIMAANSVLLTFTKIRGAIYDQAMPAIEDMATKMKLDLSSATMMVGKALQDPILGMTTLRREGVILTDVQQAQIKKFIELGQTEKAQAIILKELNVEFGGSAEAAAKAGTGGFTILSNKMKEFKESIGERLTTSLGGLSTWLGKVVDTGTKWMEIPLSEKMEDERLKVMMLGNRISDTNLPMTERNKLYDELKAIAPEVLTGIDKESIAYGTLRDNLKSYNDEKRTEIFLKKKKEELESAAEDANTYFEKMMDAQSNWEEHTTTMVDDLTKIAPKIGDKLQAILGGDDTFETKFSSIIQIAKKNSTTSNAALKYVLTDYLNNTNELYGFYFNQLNKYDVSNTYLTKLEKAYNKFAKNLKPKLNPKAKGDIADDATITDDGVGVKTSGASDAIASGGTRNTSINITFKNLVDTINYTGGVGENETDMEKQLTEGLLRVLNMAYSTA